MTKTYLIHIWGSVEPHIYGPISSDAQMNRRLGKLIRGSQTCDEFYRLEIGRTGKPKMYAFMQEKIDELVCGGHK